MIRVVLLEVEPNSAQDIAGQLQRVSYDVVALPAVVDEVIAHIDELQPDVILLDVRLKGEMDKVEAALQIKRLHDVPVILVTADTDEATVRQAIAAEPDGILIKPLEEVELVAAIDVVIQKHRKERQIRQSERRIRELTDSLPQVVYETDAQGAFTLVNAACLSLFGYKKEEFEAGLAIFDTIIPDERSEVHEVFKRWMGGETIVHLERTGLRKDGSTFPIALRAAAIEYNGALTGVRGVILDITELKRAEKELIHERDQAQLYLNTVDVIMVALNGEGRITLLNRAGCALLGVTLEQAVGTDWFETFLPEDVRTETRGMFEALMAGDRETIRSVEGVLLSSSGEERVVAWHNAPVQDHQGTVTGMFSTAVDVTERARADEKLRESERHIRELTDALPVVVYESDMSGRVTFANATSYDMFGYAKEEFEAGMSIFDIVADADKERARTMSRRRRDMEYVGRAEYTGLRKDGSTFPIAAVGAPISRDGVVVGVRGVIIDITDQKLAEERVREHSHTIETLNRIMTEGNRAASVESFAKTLTTLTLELMHFDAGTIHVFDDGARHSNLRYATGLPDTVVAAIRQIPLDETPYAVLLNEGAPIFVEGDEVRRVPQVAELGLKSGAVVGLHRLDEIIGAFSVGSFKRHKFSQTEKDLLVAIGNEAGGVIAKLQSDALIRESLKERETLLKEIHHRVKNNMQVISSLLSLQAAQAKEPETIHMLSESQGRIRSMALIHEQLYRSGSLAEIDFARYVESLIDELLRMYHVALGTVTITVGIQNVSLGVDMAIPCALIINELVSNCLKHAFPDGRTGVATVGLEHENGTYTLTVTDNGVRFPADLDFRATESLGMQLVVMLVNQLDGTITLDRTNGTTFTITFEPQTHREREGEREGG